ncbi:MAG: glycosyltransferase [Anaerolineae bacterium]|nr:glycosyltransferase [Anaerolineae bacterium]
MFVHNSVRKDARVQKEAASLVRAGWRVIVVGLALTETDIPSVESMDGYTIWRVIPPLPVGTTRSSWGKLLRLIVAIPLIIGRIRATGARVFHGNDFIGLLIMALAGIWRRPVIYDAHELFFDRWPADSTYPLRRPLLMLRPLEGWLARRAAAVMTVGDKLADRLVETLKIARPVVVRNAVDLTKLGTAVPIERRPGERLVAHSGALVQGRNLKELIDCLPHLPDDITLTLIGDGVLRPALAPQAEALGGRDRLRMVYPVTPTTIPPTLAQADAAVVLISSFALNYHFSLPNKLFEAVAAGVPLVVSDIPEVAGLVRQYDMGIVVDSMEPKAIAAAIEQVLEPTVNARYRANVLKAREVLNWAAEEQKLVALYRQIFDGLL